MRGFRITGKPRAVESASTDLMTEWIEIEPVYRRYLLANLYQAIRRQG